MGLETKLILETQTPHFSSLICAPVYAPIHRLAPIESPISKLLPSKLVDEVHVVGEQIHPITKPWGHKWMEQSHSLGTGHSLDMETFLDKVILLGNGVVDQEKDFLHPLSERNLLSPFEPKSCFPSCIFTPL